MPRLHSLICTVLASSKHCIVARLLYMHLIAQTMCTTRTLRVIASWRVPVPRPLIYELPTKTPNSRSLVDVAQPAIPLIYRVLTYILSHLSPRLSHCGCSTSPSLRLSEDLRDRHAGLFIFISVMK